MNIIDLRSDTVTRPCTAMLSSMITAPLGDDVYGEDPTVNKLEHMSATITGKQAALFCPTGTQSNLLALLSHCQRGDEYIAGVSAHCYLYEAGGASVLGGIQSQPIRIEDDGTIDLDIIRRAIKPDDSHFAITRLLCLENTVSGKVLPLDYLDAIADFKRAYGLKTHLDGARLFNAVVASGDSASRICQSFDSVSFCLSKGLSAPAGSMLCASEALISKARRLRKMLGGGMRQVGVLAATGIYALQNNISRLSEDHGKADLLARKLQTVDQLLSVTVHTNMVFIRVVLGTGARFINDLREQKILVSDTLTDNDYLRLVIHKDITDYDIDKVAKIIDRCFRA